MLIALLFIIDIFKWFSVGIGTKIFLPNAIVGCPGVGSEQYWLFDFDLYIILLLCLISINNNNNDNDNKLKKIIIS